MNKIGLSSQQRFIILGIFAVFVVVFIIAFFSGKPSSKSQQSNMFAHYEIEYQNADSVMRLFYPGVIIGDSVRYEEIRGAASGFVIQVFLVGKECDYVLTFDSRDADLILNQGDTLVFTTYYFSKRAISNFTHSLESFIPLNPNNSITDVIDFTDYYVSLMCTHKDSCISISGVSTASAFLLNPLYEDDEILINGYFRADSIPVGRRTVN